MARQCEVCISPAVLHFAVLVAENWSTSASAMTNTHPSPLSIVCRPGGQLVAYQGDRSARALKDYALSLLPHDVPTLTTQVG